MCAHRLDRTLELAFQAVGIDDLAAIMHEGKLRPADDAGAAVNFDLGNRANIGAAQLIFDVGDPTPLGDIAASILLRRRALLPLGERRQTAVGGRSPEVLVR